MVDACAFALPKEKAREHQVPSTCSSSLICSRGLHRQGQELGRSLWGGKRVSDAGARSCASTHERWRRLHRGLKARMGAVVFEVVSGTRWDII